MIRIIKSTGFVILPYFKYPVLPDIILQLLRVESNATIRQEVLRLIGALGAIDSFHYKKLKYLTTEEQKHAEELLADKFKTKFTASFDPNNLKKNKNKTLAQLHDFYNEIVVLYDLDRKKIGGEIHKEILDESTNQQEKNDRVDGGTSSTKQSDELEVLLSTPDQINLGKIDYYTTVTIKAILKVLIDPSLQQYHELALEALIYILGVLRSRSSVFLYLVIPVLTQVISVCDQSIRDSLLHRIEKIIKLCGSSFQEAYVDTVLQIVLRYIYDPKLLTKCFEIFNTIVSNCKKHLTHKMEVITTKLNQMLIQYEDQSQIVVWVLRIYNNLGELVNFYLDNIITIIAQMQHSNPVFLEREVVAQTLAFLSNIIENAPGAIQFASKIVQTMLIILENHQPSQGIVINLFIRMLQIFREGFKQ